MKNLKKLCSSVIAVILCVAMLGQVVAATETEAAPKTLYLKDMKIIYADSETEAKEHR